MIIFLEEIPGNKILNYEFYIVKLFFLKLHQKIKHERVK